MNPDTSKVDTRRQRRPRANRPAETAARLRRPEAVRLKTLGKTYREIGQILGVSHETARSYVQAELTTAADIGRHEVAFLRALEHARLEAMLQRIMPLATRLDIVVETTKEGKHGPVTIALEDFQAGIRAVDAVIKISARIAALFGLDAPRRTEVGGIGGESPGQALSPELEAAIAKAYDEAAAGSGSDKIVAFPAASRGSKRLARL